jgi:redox-sensitive bicupin YhaK (pirin superfamily)
MEDWFPRGVFGKHLHRRIETVTYVVEGRIDHCDNQGHEGTILPGDVRWMTTGRGLIHNKIPAEGVTVHSLQLWVNLPAADKMTGSRYQDLAGDAVPVGRQPGVVVRAFFGASVPQANVAR